MPGSSGPTLGPAEPAIDDRRLLSEARYSCRGSSTLIHSSRLTLRSWIGNPTTDYATCFYRSMSDSWASTFGRVESAIDDRYMPSRACDSRRSSCTPFNQPTWPCAAGFETRVTRQLSMQGAPAALRLARRRPRWVRRSQPSTITGTACLTEPATAAEALPGRRSLSTSPSGRAPLVSDFDK
jgi:hypothetical protein